MYLLNSSVLYNICEHSQPSVLKSSQGTGLRKKKKKQEKNENQIEILIFKLEF
jgi:hypothetical protein